MKNRLKLMIVGIVFLMVFVGSVSASSVTPTLIPGANNNGKLCADVIPGTTEFKITPPDSAYSGSFNDGVLYVSIVKPSTLALFLGDDKSFDFTSNIAVLGVVVKDGEDGAYFYDYRTSGSYGDTLLTTPIPTNKDISHMNFCYMPPTNAPEFPTLALPVGMMIGMVGLVYAVMKREH